MSAFGDWLGTIKNTFQIGNRLTGFQSLIFHNGFINFLRANPSAARTWTLPDKSGTLSLLDDIKIVFQQSPPTNLSLFWWETNATGQPLRDFFWTWNGSEWVSPILERQSDFVDTAYAYIKFSSNYVASVESINFHSYYSENIRYLITQIDLSITHSFDLGSIVQASNVSYAASFDVPPNKMIEYKPSEQNNMSSEKLSFGTVTIFYRVKRP